MHKIENLQYVLYYYLVFFRIDNFLPIISVGITRPYGPSSFKFWVLKQVFITEISYQSFHFVAKMWHEFEKETSMHTKSKPTRQLKLENLSFVEKEAYANEIWSSQASNPIPMDSAIFKLNPISDSDGSKSWW